MADSIEQKLVTRALAVLAAIDGTGDYQTTLGQTMSGGVLVPSIADSRQQWDAGDPDTSRASELPAISVFQDAVEIEDRDDEAQKVLRKLPLWFRGSLPRGTSAATARAFLADIMRALRTAGDKWVVSGTPLAAYTEEGMHMIETIEDSYEIIGVQQQIFIYYAGSNLDMEA